MLAMTTGFDVAAWMGVGAVIALAATMLRQKLQDRRDARLRGDWDSY
jgi:hypothetical protein